MLVSNTRTEPEATNDGNNVDYNYKKVHDDPKAGLLTSLDTVHQDITL